MSEGTQRDPHRRWGERRTLLRTIPLLAGRRRWLRWVAPAVVLLLVVTGLATWYRAAREPSLPLDQLVAELDAWPGVTYRGRVSDGVFDPADVVATVNRAGNTHGTIARDGGHAEFAVIGADQFIKADRAWWEASDPTDRDRFTGVWLRNPGGQFGVIPSLLAAPGRLADRLRTSVPWHPEGPQPVDGVPARAYSAAGAGGGRLLVASDAASDRAEPRLLAVEPPTGPDVTARLAVARPDAAALAAIDTLAPQVAGAANYWDMVLARAQLSINTTFPPTPCATRTCPAFIQLTNSGTLPAPAGWRRGWTARWCRRSRSSPPRARRKTSPRTQPTRSSPAGAAPCTGRSGSARPRPTINAAPAPMIPAKGGGHHARAAHRYSRRNPRPARGRNGVEERL